MAGGSPKRVLDPVERVTEVLFGLIMVLATTCSFSVGGAGHVEVREMLVGALGCNVAWGLIDGVMYLIACFGARGRDIRVLHAARRASTPAEAQRAIAAALPPYLAAAASPAELEAMRRRLEEMPDPPAGPRLAKEDWLGALAVCLVVILATLPVSVPFLVLGDPARALRISNAVAVVMLFLAGYELGSHVAHRPWTTGIALVIVGVAMVGLTIALGG